MSLIWESVLIVLNASSRKLRCCLHREQPGHGGISEDSIISLRVASEVLLTAELK